METIHVPVPTKPEQNFFYSNNNLNYIWSW